MILSLKPFFFALLIIIILDLIWLGLIAKNIYKKELGDKMADKINWISAFFVYILLSLGIVIFVINNNLVNSRLNALILGSVLGLIVYGVYDLTNLAVLKNYSLKLTIIDMIWGTILSGVTSFVVYLFK